MYEYLLIFITALGVTYLLAVPARELAMRFGAFARVRDRDVHEIPIPYFGGVAMMGGLAAAFLVATQLPFLNNSPERGVIFGDALAVLVGGAVICLLGAVDDVFELDALTKLAGQMLAAGVVVVQGVQLYLPLPVDGALGILSLGGSEATLVTVFFLVMSVNAVNFVDGLDGLAAGVVGIGAVAFFVFSVALVVFNQADRATTATMLTAALAGVCFGFLPHNFFPARMFMGDSGALLIGFMLAGSVISLTSQFSAGTLARGVYGADASLLPSFLLPLILPFAVLLVPFADLVMAVLRRTRAGRSPISPDRQHLHHRLLEIGHSQRRAVLVMYLWTGLIAFGVVVTSLVSVWWSALGVAALAAVALLLTFGVPGHRGIINADKA